MFVRMSACTDTRANTKGCGGALELGDSRLFEHGSERRGALGSDLVATDAANEGRSGNGGRASVSMGADTKANTRVSRLVAHLSEVTALPLSASHSLVMHLVV